MISALGNWPPTANVPSTSSQPATSQIDQWADRGAADGLASFQMLGKSPPAAKRQHLRQRFASGLRVHPTVGDPDEVAAELDRTRNASVPGTIVAAVTDNDERRYFGQEMLPQPVRLALRAVSQPSPAPEKRIPEAA